MRRALLVVAGIAVAVPLAAVGAATVLLNGDAVKRRLADEVRHATGRELLVAGPVTLAWSLSPTLSLADVSLGNPPGFPDPTMAHADRVEARVALGALWQGRVEIERIAVASPSIRLEQDAAGQGNWVFTPPAPSPTTSAAPAGPGGPRLAVSVGTVELDNASLVWNGRTLTAPRLAYRAQDGSLTGTLESAGTSLALSGRIGPLATTPYPVDLHLSGPGMTAGLTGTSAAANLSATASDLAALSPLAGRALPPVRDVSLTAALPGPGAIRLTIGAASAGRLSLRGATLTAASLADPAAVTAAGTLDSRPFDLGGHVAIAALLRAAPAPFDTQLQLAGLHATGAGTVVLQPGAVALTGLRLGATTGQAGASDLAGDLTLGYAGRPSLRGTLTGARLDLPGLAAALSPAPVPSPAPAAPPAPAASAPASEARLIPALPLPLAPLRAADLDLRLSVASLAVAGTALSDVQAHVSLADGSLQIDPASIGLGGTPARFTLTLAAASPAQLRFTLDAPGLPFGAVSALAGGPADATGTLDLRADLRATGDTARALAASLGGQAGAALADGQVDNAVLERLAAGPLGAAGVSFPAGGRTTVPCAVIRVEAAAGQVTLPTLALDTSRLSLDGGGTVDLGTEALDLHLRPHLRLGGGLSVPLRVRGTLAAPRAQLDPGAIASGRVGLLLGGPPAPDACGPALAAMRTGQVPPAAPPPRPVKPADLLRGLLR